MSTRDLDATAPGVPARPGREGSGAARLALKLVVLTVAMFGFGYALVPLYDLVCDITGINGRTGVVEASEVPGRADASRSVEVQFLTTVNGALPWQFEALAPRMEIHPGRVYEARFIARNRSGRTVTAQAVPSVSPSEAARHFSKTECFCFTRQTLEPGEAREMPVRFVVDERLPAHVRTLTLAYTFFETGESG